MDQGVIMRPATASPWTGATSPQWACSHTVSSIEDALRLLADVGPRARLVAGGTDLLVELRHPGGVPPVLIDVSRLARPGTVGTIHLDTEGWIHIGPLVTHNQAAASALLVERASPLAQACSQVGTPQLRNRATVAGNLVTASPANDTIPVLWALGGRLTLEGVRGRRTIELQDFYRGVRRTELAPDEMVTDIAFPALRSDGRAQTGVRQFGGFLKLGLRRTPAGAIAVVNAAAVLTAVNDRVTTARITLGSVAPTIVRAREAEKALAGAPLSEERIAEAAALAAAATCPIDDVRAGAAYRREMVAVLVRRLLTGAAGRAERADVPRTGEGATTATAQEMPRLWGRTDGRFAPWEGGCLTHLDPRGAPVEFRVNGRPARVEGAARKTLLAMLRDDLGLTGAKEGCGEGECGACTVWMDGIAVLACLVPAPRAHGTEIVTVEGLAREATLHPVQEAFISHGAVQCGYCTPGFVMSGANLLEENPQATREQIVAALEGNLCRCTGYYKIVRAVEEAAKRSAYAPGRGRARVLGVAVDPEGEG